MAVLLFASGVSEGWTLDDNPGARAPPRSSPGVPGSHPKSIHPGFTPLTVAVGHERPRRHDPEPAGLVVLHGLHDLGPGVHDERAVPGHRLPDRLPAQHHD